MPQSRQQNVFYASQHHIQLTILISRHGYKVCDTLCASRSTWKWKNEPVGEPHHWRAHWSLHAARAHHLWELYNYHWAKWEGTRTKVDSNWRLLTMSYTNSHTQAIWHWCRSRIKSIWLSRRWCCTPLLPSNWSHSGGQGRSQEQPAGLHRWNFEAGSWKTALRHSRWNKDGFERGKKGLRSRLLL